MRLTLTTLNEMIECKGRHLIKEKGRYVVYANAGPVLRKVQGMKTFKEIKFRTLKEAKEYFGL
jgi:hypothetical protein